jgi:hypothetical protein
MIRGDAGQRDHIARWLLRGALADRCAIHARPLRVKFSTFPGSGTSHAVADLIVDWSPEFVDAAVDWTLLQTSLTDLEEEIAAVRRPIEVDVQARLVPAFVLGHAFPLASRIGVTAIHRDGSRWTIGSPDPTKVAVSRSKLDDGNGAVAVVEVSLARDVTASVASAVERLRLQPGWSARLTFADGIETVDPFVAGAASASFGQVLRDLRDVGVRHAHVFIATPAALALLLGASVNVGPEMTLYHTTAGEYRAAVALAS